MSLSIFLIRHGIAAERGTYPNDDDRPLTEQGEIKTKKIAKQLKTLGVQFDVILTSPLVRAYQTTEILKTAGLSQQVEITNCLSPDGNIQSWLGWLQHWEPGKQGAIALVGHQPDLGHWAEALVCGGIRSNFVVKKAGIIGIQVSDVDKPLGNSQLFWLTAPRFLLG